MDQEERRLRLRVAAKLMLALGFFATLYVVLSVLLHADPASRVMPTQSVQIGGMRPGDVRKLLWEGRPVLVYYRTRDDIARLAEANGSVA